MEERDGPYPGSWDRLARSLTEVALWTLDDAGRITAWNEGAHRLLGYTADQARELRLADLMGAAPREDAGWALQIARVQGGLKRELELRRADGASLRVELLLVPLRDSPTTPPGFAGVARQAPPGRWQEDTLRRSEERLHRVLDLVHEGILVLDDAGRIIHANHAAGRLLDLDEPPRGRRYDDPSLAWVPLPDTAHGPAAFGFVRVVRTGEPSRDLPAMLERRDGAVTHLQLDAVPLRPHDAPGAVLVTMRDVTARRNAEAERVRRERLEAEGRRLVEVEEQERARIARELHDEIGQSVTLLLQKLSCGEALETRLAEATALARTVIEQVRGAVMDLRPSALDDLGLCTALLALTDRFTARSGLTVDFRHAGLAAPLPDVVAATVYRIAQEALTNAARHSGADQVQLSVRRDGATLTLEISDRGRGFDPDTASPRESSGLAGIRSRARLLGAQLDLDTAPGAGCRLRVEFPL